MIKDTRKYRDRAQYNIQAVAKRRRKLKRMAIELKGGKCQICGYNRYVGALDFHHFVESKKEFDLSTKGLTRSWEKIKKSHQMCTNLRELPQRNTWRDN